MPKHNNIPTFSPNLRVIRPPQARKYGMTEPISLDPPTEHDLVSTAQMKKILMDDFHLFESEEQSQKREMVLGRLHAIANEWVKEVSLAKGFSEQLAAEAGAKIYTFGSYRLGVHGDNADIDTLCVGPRHVTRADFFDGLYKMLEKEPEVHNLSAVPEAYVPVITFSFSSIDVSSAPFPIPLSHLIAANSVSDNRTILDGFSLCQLRQAHYS